MAFQEGTNILTCPHCGARHEAEWHRLPVREPYSLRCKRCTGTLASGKGIKDYMSVRLVARD